MARTGCRVIVDTSALIAILYDEPEATACIKALYAAPNCRISAATCLEAGIIIDSARSAVPSRRLDDLLTQTGVTIEPVTEDQARIARAAYRDYGRGSGPPARLNFGDCFAYALARSTGEALLFKGGDFAHTDVTPAREPSR
jgi:ribonuclease VapC